MYNKNDGKTDNDILQNQFTAYLAVSVSNARIDYLRSRIKRLQRELITEEQEVFFTYHADFIEFLANSDALERAMRSIKAKERYVVLARVLYEKSFEEIARDLNMGYKGVAAIYYRAIKKLRGLLGGDNG